MTVLIKLGGSVLTDKRKLRTYRAAPAEALAKALARVEEPLVLVHGAGSFGHILAKRHAIHEGFSSEAQLHAIAEIQRDVRDLNLRLLSVLLRVGIRAVSIPPAACCRFRSRKVVAFDPRLFEEALELQLTPVTFGDVVPDEALRFSICSGDLLMERLAEHFRPRLAVFCADVDGVFTEDPARSPKAKLLDKIDLRSIPAIAASAPAVPDITGSLGGKLEQMARIAHHVHECLILNGLKPERLLRAVRGQAVRATRVIG